MIMLEHLPYDTDGGGGSAARVGLIMLASDYTIESEFHALFRHVPELGLFSNRIFNDDQITPETLRAMAPRITTAAAEILPGARLDVVAYGCTSASIAIGEEGVFERIRAARPTALCTTPITAAFAAFHSLGASRIGVLTPYRADVNELVAAYITSHGFEVPVFGSFNEESDAAVATITATSVRDGIDVLARSGEIDAVFVSCTSVRLADAVESIERHLGLPVTSSNHAMAWHAIRLAGVTKPLSNCGRLFTLPLAAPAPSSA